MNGIQKQLEQYLAAGDFSRYFTYLNKVKIDLDRSTGLVRDKKKNKEQLLQIQASQLAIADQAILDEQKRHEDLKFIYDWGMAQLATDKNRTKANNMRVALESDLKNLNKPKLMKTDEICNQIVSLDPTLHEWAMKFKLTVAKLFGVTQEITPIKTIAQPEKPKIDPNITQPRKRKVLKTVEVEEDE